MLRQAIRLSVTVLVVLAAVLAINTARHRSRQITAPAAARAAIDERAVSERLAGAVRFRTISYEPPSAVSRSELLKLHRYLAESFPKTHAALTLEIVGGYSLLYTWAGQDAGAQPILLMAHQDVVPVAPGTEGRWHADPFGGAIRDGFIWGRGAWDDKGNLMAILEAVESLAAAGFKPRRTVYLAFGHDEENGGEEGAAAIAELLASRGVHCEFALDEGLLITEGIMPGVAAPVALVGVAEKGSVTLRLKATANPRHSSMPSKVSAIGTLARALVRVESSPMPAAIGGVTGEMFDAVVPEMQGINRIILSNRWLFGPLILAQLERIPSTNAMLRTTAAITVVRGGNKENVLPGEAEALVNFRLMPGDTSAGVLDHVRRAIGNESVTVEVAGAATEASPVAAHDSAAYRVIERTIRELFPQVIVAPGLMIGGTDSRHMTAVADAIFRFSPVRARAEDLLRFHGTDERIAVANYADLIRFYGALIRHSAGGDQAATSTRVL
jgi:carboxypeptidase PM20D1